MIVVMAERDGETLRTVSLTLPHAAALPVGTVMEVGTGAADDQRPVVDAVVGDLVVDVRSDGARVISSVNAVTAVSTGGTLTVGSRDAGSVAGTFQVELDDGGHLRGTFAAALAR